jgi:hypothetical protein
LLKLSPGQGLTDLDVPARIGPVGDDLKAEGAQLAGDGCLTAAEVGGLQRSELRELVAMGNAGNGLGVIVLPVMHQQVLAGSPEPIALQEGLLTKPVIVSERLKDSCTA